MLQPWHRADIVAAVRKRGSTLRQLSLQHGFAESTLRASLERLHPVAHTIISEFIDQPRQIIWPQFYDLDGRRMSLPEQRRRAIIAARAQRSAA
jgi:Ner family transcriptional regulator